MATGDVKGNLKHARYPKDLDYTSLSRGSPKEFLPIMHYMLCDYSRPVTQLILESKMELCAKTDQNFMEVFYKVLRDVLHYDPRITGPRVFSRGFAKHKILLTRDVVSLVRNKRKRLTRGKATVRPNSGQDQIQGAAERGGIITTTKKASVELDVVYAAQLSDVPCEDFKPSLNSTVAVDSTGFSSPVPHASGSDDQHAVSIVAIGIVVGMTPVPMQLAVCPTVETPRRPRVRTPDTTLDGSPVHASRPVIYDSDLKTRAGVLIYQLSINNINKTN